MANVSEELYIFAERYAHFSNIHTVYRDLLSGHYKPSVTVNPDPNEWSITDVGSTMMIVLYSYFYSLVEDDEKSVNGFRIWRQQWPEEEAAITAVEAQITPLRDNLRLLRNRLGFHGSRSRDHEKTAVDFFALHSGTEVWSAMGNFKSLGAALFAKDVARQNGADQTPARQWIDKITARARGC